jgi:hypothetical protein
MTNLTAECWKLAAQLYLLCRLLRYVHKAAAGFVSLYNSKFPRLRRNDPLVLERLSLLAECTAHMPCSGPVFTAQAPFLPVFLLGFLATEDSHRVAASNWFETVITATSCRSVSATSHAVKPFHSNTCAQSVPPAWEALKKIQKWMDRSIADPDETPPFEARDPWWETVVSRLNETEGILCLT